MKIKNIEPLSLENWRKEFFKLDPMAETHWKIGGSAYSLADFLVNRSGEERIKEIVGKVFKNDLPVVIESGEIEFACQFDKYNGPRKQDIGIWGKTKSGRRFFVGVEAKVNETFGNALKDERQEAVKEKEKNDRSNKVDRIDELCHRFGCDWAEIPEIRYQLLHFTAGTACVKDVDVCIMLTIVFHTDSYNEKTGQNNKDDYNMFMEKFFEREEGIWRLKELDFPMRPYALCLEVDL